MPRLFSETTHMLDRAERKRNYEVSDDAAGMSCIRFHSTIETPDVRCYHAVSCAPIPTENVHLVEEPDDFARNVLPPRFLVVHDASGSGQDDVAELTGWQKVDDPLLHIAQLDVVPWADDTGLVDAAPQN